MFWFILGYFNLDPNRVLDILLEAFECSVDEDLHFVPLISDYLKQCDVSGFCHLIGFKFQYYHVRTSCFIHLYLREISIKRSNYITCVIFYLKSFSNILYFQQSMDSKTPDTLYKLTACLLRNNLIELEQLYPHVSQSSCIKKYQSIRFY